MRAERLSTFTDGVVAIVITIMVLELPLPHGGGLGALRPVLPLLAAYALSFLYLGIYWNNHHHMMSLVERVDGRVLWANHFLLFWLSLMPFVIRWVAEVHFQPEPVAAFGFVLLMSGLAYFLLEKAILAVEGCDSKLGDAIGRGKKEWVSQLLYAASIPIAFFSAWISLTIYVVVALLWFLPDQRVERALKEDGKAP